MVKRPTTEQESEIRNFIRRGLYVDGAGRFHWKEPNWCRAEELYTYEENGHVFVELPSGTVAAAAWVVAFILNVDVDAEYIAFKDGNMCNLDSTNLFYVWQRRRRIEHLPVFSL
jgi:hypothetical protein